MKLLALLVTLLIVCMHTISSEYEVKNTNIETATVVCHNIPVLQYNVIATIELMIGEYVTLYI